MIKTPISLQDLRKNLYIKAKTEPTWRFWGLYTHVCKRETLQEAYEMAKKNDGAICADILHFPARVLARQTVVVALLRPSGRGTV